MVNNYSGPKSSHNHYTDHNIDPGNFTFTIRDMTLLFHCLYEAQNLEIIFTLELESSRLVFVLNPLDLYILGF